MKINHDHGHHVREHSELVVDGMGVSLVMGHVPPDRGLPLRSACRPSQSHHGPEPHQLGPIRSVQYVVTRALPAIVRPGHGL